MKTILVPLRRRAGIVRQSFFASGLSLILRAGANMFEQVALIYGVNES